MDVSLFVRGLVIGFSIAAPVGPIGVLCIRRTLAEGQLYGLVSGLGAATADALYGCVAGFGLTFISAFLIGHKLWLSLIGGLFLLYLGIKTLLSKPAEDAAKAEGKGLFRAYASTFLLTVTNPMTILSFAAIFAALGLAKRHRQLCVRTDPGAGSLSVARQLGGSYYPLAWDCFVTNSMRADYFGSTVSQERSSRFLV